MRLMLGLAVLLGSVLVLRLRGEESTRKPAAAPTAEQLINQLSSKDFQVRENASKALAALGKEALPAMQKARALSDPETRRRLDELIPPLERALTLAPKLVTLHMTNKPIGDVLGELSKQTGYKISTNNEWAPQIVNNNQPGRKDRIVYTFHLDKVPFWQALDKVCEAGGMVLQQYYGGWGGDDSLHVFPQEAYVPFASYTGPFKVMATSFNYSRSNNFGTLPKNPVQPAQQANEFLQVNLQVATEPKLPILRVGQVKLQAALDDEGHSMMPRPDQVGGGPWGRMYYGWYRGYVQQAQANLSWPSKSSRTVKLLKGIIPVTLLADQKPSIVTDRILSSKGKKFKVGDATFHIEDITEMPGNQYQIKLSVTENSKDAPNDYSRIQTIQQRLELQDDKGNKLYSYMNMMNWGGPNNAQFTLVVQPPGNAKIGKPAKLIYSAWILMEHEIAFEFRNLPLP